MSLPTLTRKQLAAYIDHTLLKPAATEEDVLRLCEEAAANGFASVCIAPCWVPAAFKALEKSAARVCTVAGFPNGYTTSAAKAHEARYAANEGADEIDMVINVGLLRSLEPALVRDDIAAVVRAVPGHVVKVIIETALLTNDEKILACQIAEKAGAHFVKTSTGFNGGGATVEDIELMKRTVGDRLEVKASGGIRDRETALAMIAAGATRLGTSASLAILDGTDGEGKGY